MTVTVGVALPWCWSLDSAAQSTGARLRISADTDQRVSIVGSSESLREAVEELCERTGVRLLSYDAADRPFSAHYEDLPLPRVLARLLRPESYMVGLRSAPQGEDTQIAWLRVIGEPGQASGPVISSRLRNAGTNFPVPANVLARAFSSENQKDREDAMNEITAAFSANPDAMKAFLQVPPVNVAEAVYEYPYAKQVLMHIQRVQTDVAFRRKLGMVLSEVNKLVRNASR